MKIYPISATILKKVFKCQGGNYARVETWGEGSCFFHSLAMLLVSHNHTLDQKVVFHLKTPSSSYRRFEVSAKTPFRESFRQVGLDLRRRLAQELQEHPNLWKKFQATKHINLERTDKKRQTHKDIVKELFNVSTWADIWTICYCAWRLRVNVLFINPASSDEPIYCGVENFRHFGITVFIYWSNHTHFEPVVQVECNGKFKRTFGQNHKFMQCLKSQYKQGCPNDPINR